MATLADTNILLRVAHADSPERKLALGATEALVLTGERVVVSSQNLVEFRAVATRPPEARGGLGMTAAEADEAAEDLEAIFELLEDPPGVYAEWKRLVKERAICGVRVHDARLVAVMRLGGIGQILTFDVADFGGFPCVRVVHPRDVLAEPAGPSGTDAE